ncbi:MAG: universal stress protein [Chloroflexi bacterium]|nr:universal stress protein [Chloroflexota bacterium]
MYQKIMVPLDGSALAECVLPHVTTLAQACGAGQVVLVRVVEPVHLPTDPGVAIDASTLARIETEQRVEAEKYLQDVVKRLKGVVDQAKAEVLFGIAADALPGYASAHGVDLIVIATHGRSGISRWVWGSVAERVLRAACAPVMMVRPAGCPVACLHPEAAVAGERTT